MLKIKYGTFRGSKYPQINFYTAQKSPAVSTYALLFKF